MADTKRALADLQTLLANNTSGDISAQDARDVLVSTYGGRVPMEEHSASASATLDFTSWYNALFDSYEIELINVLNATNTQDLQLQVSTDGGSSWETAGNYYYGWFWVSNTGSGVVTNGAVSQFALVTAVDNTFGGVRGNIWFKSPAGSLPRRAMSWKVDAGQASQHLWVDGGGTWAVSTAVNGIRFKFASGNITSGIIRVYGIAK